MTADPAEVPLGEAAYHRLRDDIVACRLLPGQRFTERRLSAQLGMGVSPIREALTRLDHEGLIVTLPRKGYQVAPLTIRAVDDLFDFWSLIGPEIARRGLQNGSATQLERIRDGFVTLHQLIDDGISDSSATAEFLSLASATFRELADATGNSYLSNVMDRLVSDLRRVYTLILGSDVSTRIALLSQTDFGAVVQSGDGDLFAEEARRFIRDSHNEVLRILVRWPSVMAAEVVAT